MPVIMGTAGHIDHGKTTLVRALTGIDCDRLAEEKERGITIELGFAHLDLASGERLGIVDVPGHERFVKNMVAGAAGIDFVTLVIAADEGIMPQTREHLDICTLLGTKTGLVALTKIDMVEEEWLEMVREDLREFLTGTFLEEAPVIPVSARTGQGMDMYRAELEKMAGEFTPRRRTDLFRLPVDRVFTMRGHGTVVTGTMVSGSLSLGQEVRAYPGTKTAKVRGLQSHGQTVEVAPAGRRTAVNLGGLDVADLDRGDTLALPGELFPRESWDLELTCLKSSPRPLKNRREAHFHHGAKEVLARLLFLDRDELKPGETCCCRVQFPSPLAGVYGDRVVVRSFSPLRAVVGGRVINPVGRRIKRFSRDVERLDKLAQGEEQDLVLTQLALAGTRGVTYAMLRIMTDLESKGLEKLLQDLGGKQQAFVFDREERAYVGEETVEDCLVRAEEFLKAFHEAEPIKAGMSRGALGSAWGRETPEKLRHFLIERMLKTGRLEADGEFLRLPGHQASLAGDQAEMGRRLLAAYTEAGLTAPNYKELLERESMDPKQAAKVFGLLTEQGDLVKVKEELYFHAPALEGLKKLVLDFYSRNDEMGPVELRELTGLSRKYLIPLLEYMDRIKLTVRVGDKRRLRKAGS